MKVKVTKQTTRTKQTTWTIEIIPVQKKSPTGGNPNQQSNSANINIVNQNK